MPSKDNGLMCATDEDDMIIQEMYFTSMERVSLPHRPTDIMTPKTNKLTIREGNVNTLYYLSLL